MSRELSFATRRRNVSRVGAGVAALSYPTALVVMTLATGFRRLGDLTDLAASFLASLLFLIAAPTAWVFSFEFIDVSRFTVLAVGILTSYPLWYLLGARLAVDVDHWAVWVRRYAAACVAWTTSVLVVVALLAQILD